MSLGFGTSTVMLGQKLGVLHPERQTELKEDHLAVVNRLDAMKEF